MKVTPLRPRIAAVLLLIALLACAAVAVLRIRVERHSNRVELAMDYGDFAGLSRSYGYNTGNFLIALRRAGLTSLALSEELGANVSTDGNAYVIDGNSLIERSRVMPVSDPLLASRLRTHRIDRRSIYLVVARKSTFERYQTALHLHFESKSIHILRNRAPWLIQVNTQLDYFNQIGLGIPNRQLALARRLGLLIIPRFQNDERYDRASIDGLFGMLGNPRQISTVIFFGLRNQVLGFPTHIKATASALLRNGWNFGTIEIYDKSQLQKGNNELATLVNGDTVRVQAIAKTELDRLRVPTVLARYELGVRERNVRVVYLRPFAHRRGDLTLEQTNVQLIGTLVGALRSFGFRIGRATPIPRYPGDNPVLLVLAALAIPSIFVLLLEWFGCSKLTLTGAAYAATVALTLAGILLHHEVFVRSALALVGALLFATAAFAVLVPAFLTAPQKTYLGQLRASFGTTLLAVGVALLGALVVVGLMSFPLAMVEVAHFRGVKLVLTLPPLIALAMYALSGRYGEHESATSIAQTPLRVYHLALLALVGVAGVLLVMRSGNTGDIAPSGFELMLRRDLGELLRVRPRFKEFLIGTPLLMLLPALLTQHRRAIGWLLALGIGVGLGDVIDTFSHLHTALPVSGFRIVNGVLLGAVIGSVLIWIYRRFVGTRAQA